MPSIPPAANALPAPLGLAVTMFVVDAARVEVEPLPVPVPVPVAAWLVLIVLREYGTLNGLVGRMMVKLWAPVPVPALGNGAVPVPRMWVALPENVAVKVGIAVVCTWICPSEIWMIGTPVVLLTWG